MYRLLADCVVIVHAGYIAFVVIGFALILAGIVRRWAWVRGFWFRAAHLSAILLVCAESLGGVVCPLTLLEDRLRALAGSAGYENDFIGYWIDRLIFYNLPQWVFVTIYCVFGVLVAAAFIVAAPHWPWPREMATSEAPPD